MSYLEDKLGVKTKTDIKRFLLSEGFTLPSNGYEGELSYFTEGSTYDLWLTVNLDEFEFSYLLGYHHGGGTVTESTVNYSNDLDTFEDEYKNFINEATSWLK